MQIEEKKYQLQIIIKETLSPLIDHEYIFIDLPYYNNIGDVLIWAGTEQYLKTLPHKCLYKSSFKDFVHKDINDMTIIIMQGGGNFGDIWHEHQNFRKRIIKEYPKNRIIVLPQSIYYENQENLKSDAILFSEHTNLYLCARDTYSLNILKKYFSNNSLLLPDMAFYLDFPIRRQKTGRILYLRRTDKELNLSLLKLDIPQSSEIHDWPTYEKNLNLNKILYYSSKILSKISMTLATRWRDFYQDKVMRPSMVKIGYNFLNQYDEIYSTRLHVAILGSLMGIKVHFIDNSYGKNKNVYSTWLNNLETISMSEL